MKWSLKKESVEDKTINDRSLFSPKKNSFTGIPSKKRSFKDLSMKEILKRNFIPIIFIIYSVVIIVVVSLFMGGTADNQTNDEPGNGPTSGNAVTMTAEELINDMTMDSDWSTYITMGFASLDDGDTLIVQDSISEIEYNSDVDATNIKYAITSGGSTNFWFEGDLTDSYNVGDEVKITLTIKHVTFSSDSMDYDLEIFEEQWVSGEYYLEHASETLQGMNAIPSNNIEKV